MVLAAYPVSQGKVMAETFLMDYYLRLFKA